MIQILPVEVRDQIAAGEVVERPAHMVKELMENSLDAGSSQVSVRVKEGGRVVEIQDNGKGIPADELSLALDRFATSKIQTSDDLWRLKTYGFRGEALASLAAVSQLTLISKPQNQKQGAQIKSLFGRKSSVDPISSENGTRLIVEKLFENVPARLKFLKSEGAEHQAIKNVVKAMALIRPLVDFRYFENDKLVLAYPQTKTRSERVSQVLELKSLYQAQDETNDGWRVEIFFSAPDRVAKTAKNIWIFAQDRAIQDRALQAALMDAYRSLLMHGEYPICVVNLRVPEDEIDVNIHPTKSQVKFQDSSKAFRFVHHTLRQALEQAPWIPRTQPQRQGTHSFQPITEPRVPSSAATENLKFQDAAFQAASFRQKDVPSMASHPKLTQMSTATFVREPGLAGHDSGGSTWMKALEQAAQPSFSAHVESTASVSKQTTDEVSSDKQGRLGYWSRLQVIGQVGLTYIVAQDQNKVVLVDQHAAHERVAFERLMQTWSGGKREVQEFLFPFAVDLSAAQVEAILPLTRHFEQLGFSIEQLGPSTLGVKSAPAFIKEGVLAEIFEKTADEVLEKGGSFQFEKKLVDICATLACHSVVRAGQALSVPEMKSLLEQMDDFPLSSFCPHGRPVSLEWTFDKLEKDFGRRV